jgi:hypothetical protein
MRLTDIGDVELFDLFADRASTATMPATSCACGSKQWPIGGGT